MTRPRRRAAILSSLALIASLLTVAAPTPAAAAPIDTLVVEGGGWGHSIGMSQYGAYGMALHGHSRQQILANYYSGSFLSTTAQSGVNSTLWVNIVSGLASLSVAAVSVDGANIPLTAMIGGVATLLPAGATLTMGDASTGCQITIEGAPVGAGCAVDIPLTAATVGQIGSCANTDWQDPAGPVERPCRYDRGILHLRTDRGGAVVASVEVDVEQYLFGISEMPYRWGSSGGAEALAAQAIAARTYALFRADQRADPAARPWCWCNLFDSTLDQSYVGYGHLQPEWTNAVASTSGVIVSHPSAVAGPITKPILTVYHSSSAGRTESSAAVWGTSLPYLAGSDDHWSQLPEAGNPRLRWQRVISQQELVNSGLGVGNVVAVSVAQCSASGFALALTFTGTSATKTYGTDQLRGMLGLLSPQVLSAGMGTLPDPGCWGGSATDTDTRDLRVSDVVVQDGTDGDAAGDGDGLLECGEVAELTLELSTATGPKPDLEVFVRMLGTEATQLYNASSWAGPVAIAQPGTTTADFDVQVGVTSGRQWLTLEVLAWDGGVVYRSHRHIPLGCGLSQAGSAAPPSLVFPVIGGGTPVSNWLGDGPGMINEGVDIPSAASTPVAAAAAGYVVDVDWLVDPIGGHDCCSVVIRHDNGWETWYTHLSGNGNGAGAPPGIAPGARVEQGDLIGWVAPGGAPHLQFELHDPTGIPRDPYLLLLNAPVIANRFVDDDGNFHEANIERIALAGVTQGCNPPAGDMFCPDQPVTRAEMAVFLIRALGEEGNLPPYMGFFSDVPPGAWYTEHVERLRQLGITTGFPDGTYHPEHPVLRSEMAAFLIRAFGHTAELAAPTGIFSDVPITAWYADEAELVYRLGITSGCAASPLAYCPNAAVLRDQMASFLARALGIAAG